MGRKKSYSEVYDAFKSAGLHLLDDEYKNSKTKMKCVDFGGYMYDINFESLNTCKNFSRFCNGNPYTDHNIDILLKERGNKYERITNNITTTLQQIDIIDSNGYKYRILLSSLLSRDSKLTMVGNGNYWSIYNINKYLSNTESKDILKTKEFINQNEPLDWVCENGHEFHTNWNNYFTKGFRCMDCHLENKLLSFDECSQNVDKIDGYKLIEMERRIGTVGTKVIFYHVKHECGYDYWVSKQEFDSGKRCRPCSYIANGEKRKYTTQQIKDMVECEDFTFIKDRYIDYRGKKRRQIKIKHNKCGQTKWMDLSSWTGGKRCFKCSLSDAKKIPVDVWIDRVENINTHNLKFLKLYYKHRNDNHIDARLKVKCLDCGSVIDRVAGGWNNGCPYCYNSKGEEAVRLFLLNNNIDYTPQKEFDGLIGIGCKPLSYDFYIPSCNLLIEYQGEFHDGTDRVIDKSYFPRQQEHDRRKKQYAIDNNIKLLEIWYWDYDNVESILKKELKL